jgi:hypothetical protein
MNAHIENTGTTLIDATERKASLVERRKSKTKGSWLAFADRRRRARANIGIEISPHKISLAIIREGTSGQNHLTTDEAEIGCISCNEWTLEHLTNLLQLLASKHDIQGQGVFVALGGNACVTRSFYGNNEEVDASCKEVSERASHYLALGRGEKVCCQAETAIDARRKRAWVTVAQREVLELVLRAIEDAGLRLGRIEHTLTTLCQVAGESGCDNAEPLLMVLTGGGRSDMFISFQGQLLLDYRPSASHVSQESCSVNNWTALASKHIKCLRRFLASQLPRGQANLTKICLPATEWKATPSIEDLLSTNDLSVANLDQSVVTQDMDMDCSQEKTSPEMMSAVWMARNMMNQSDLTSSQSTAVTPGDMTGSLRRHLDWSARTLVANFWPVAASILLICGLYASLVHQRSSLAETEKKLDNLQTVRVELDRLQLQMKGSDEAVTIAKRLRANLPSVQPDVAIKVLGRSLPKGAWLKQINVDASRNISVVGISYSEDGIYEYIAKLKENVSLQAIGLVSSKPIRLPSGPAFEFELKASLTAETATSVTATNVAMRSQ